MNLPAAAFFLLLSAASVHTEETPQEAQTPAQFAIPGKTGKMYAAELHAKEGKEAPASVLPPSAARRPCFRPSRKAGDQDKDVGERLQPAMQEKTWEACMEEAREKLGQGGGYACTGKALGNFIQAFSWDKGKGLRLQPGKARPSFCSSAVYGALLLALDIWNSGRGESGLDVNAWQALAPRKAPDGAGAWGCANANGPGLAVLIHKLGAGHSFTEWEKAQSGDIMKLWWTEAIGAGERGHLTIYLSQTEDSLTFWSSNQSNPGGRPGYGTKTVSKSTVKHVLFTRVTRPEAFANAPSVGTDSWLGSLLKKNVTMEETLRRCGLSPSPSKESTQP